MANNKSYTVDGVSYNATTVKEIGKERFLLNFPDDKKQGDKVWGILEKNLATDAAQEAKDKAGAELKEKNRKAAQDILDGKKGTPTTTQSGNGGNTPAS